MELALVFVTLYSPFVLQCSNTRIMNVKDSTDNYSIVDSMIKPRLNFEFVNLMNCGTKQSMYQYLKPTSNVSNSKCMAGSDVRLCNSNFG